MIKPARVRFAPSPTGHVHLGSARTAMYDYLIAKQSGGQFVLRIEDTDQKRYVEGAEEELINGLRWLGFDWDEGPDVGGEFGPYRQSERKELYQQYARQLIEQGDAYYCFCSPDRLQEVREQQNKDKQQPRYDRFCRDLPLAEADQRINDGESYVVRFKTPLTGKTTVHDYVRGDITVDNSLLDDYIIVKSDGLALYHLAAVVDDHLMKITHVIRGSEWLPTFPLHGLLHRAFGWQEPEWVHLSVFLKPSGKGKMSKRETADLLKDGRSIFLKDLKTLGYLPEAVNNWIALMGWSLDDHTEFFNLDDLVRVFSLDRLNPSPAAINFSKLDHFNGLHIRNKSVDELAVLVKPYFEQNGYVVDDEKLKKIVPIIQERLVTLDDCLPFAAFFFKDEVIPEAETLIAKKLTAAESLKIAEDVVDILENLSDVTLEIAEQPMRDYIEASGYKAGQVFGILRTAISAQEVSPPLFESMEIIGKPIVIARMKQAVNLLRTLVD